MNYLFNFFNFLIKCVVWYSSICMGSHNMLELERKCMVKQCHSDLDLDPRYSRVRVLQKAGPDQREEP